MNQAAADLGIDLPATPDLQTTGIAVLIIAAAVTAGWALGRWAGPPIADAFAVP